MSENYVGFSERVTKTVIVKRKGTRKAWTNRTTKTTENGVKNINRYVFFLKKLPVVSKLDAKTI